MSNQIPTMMRYKRWADAALYAVLEKEKSRFSASDWSTVVRIMDHIHTTDDIFKHHLLSEQHTYREPQSSIERQTSELSGLSAEMNSWLLSHADFLTISELEETLHFKFTSGVDAQMTRSEVFLHLSHHAAYHRGNVGLLLQARGIQPNPDRITDFVGITDQNSIID